MRDRTHTHTQSHTHTHTHNHTHTQSHTHTHTVVLAEWTDPPDLEPVTEGLQAPVVLFNVPMNPHLVFVAEGLGLGAWERGEGVGGVGGGRMGVEISREGMQRERRRERLRGGSETLEDQTTGEFSSSLPHLAGIDPPHHAHQLSGRHVVVHQDELVGTVANRDVELVKAPDAIEC
jgi:hypothetical protein